MNKKILLSLLLAVLVLVSVSAVSAADIKVIGTSFDDIQTAIDAANPGDSIYLNNGTYKANNTPITINTTDLTIYGGSNANDNKHSTLDGLSNFQIMLIDATNIKIVGINFVNGHAADGGAIALNINSSLTVQNCVFYNNTNFNYTEEKYDPDTGEYLYNEEYFSGSGGAIHAEFAQLNIFDSNFIENSAKDNEGGAIYTILSNVNVVNSNFTNNKADEGGAIYSVGGLLDIEKSLFNNNRAQKAGGAVFASNIVVTDSKFIHNYADDKGGAILLCSLENEILLGLQFLTGGISSSLMVDGCTFSQNKAERGTIYALLGKIDITDSTFLQNDAKTSGGAIYTSFEDILKGDTDIEFIILILKNMIVSKNNYLNIYDCNFVSNEGDIGGTIYSAYNTVIDKSHFTLNNAEDMGGAIAIIDLYSKLKENFSSTFTTFPSVDVLITNSDFNSNHAEYGGAIVFLDATVLESMLQYTKINNKDSLTILNCDFKNNYVNGNNNIGGAIFSLALNNIIDGSDFLNNTVYDYSTGGSVITTLIIGDGGAVAVYGNLNVSNSNFEKNNAIKGGAVAVYGNLNVNNSIFIENNGTSFYDIASKKDKKMSGMEVFDDKSFSKEKKSDLSNLGGAVFVIGNGIIINSTFSYNTASIGGAIAVIGGSNITSCDFIDNKATSGGAIFATNLFNIGDYKSKDSAVALKSLLSFTTYDVNIDDCYFEGNLANGSSEGDVSGFGGAILSLGNPLKVIRSYFQLNSAADGGAICFYPLNVELFIFMGKSTLNISSCGFVENTASNGGAISIVLTDDDEFTVLLLNNSVSIENSLFNNNKAEVGGAISSVPSMDKRKTRALADSGESDIESFIGKLSLAHITGSVFVENTASKYGGAIAGLALVVNYNIFELNDAIMGSAVLDVTSEIPDEEIVSLIKSNYDYNFWGLANDVTKFPKNMVSGMYGSLAPANWVVVDIAEPLKGGNVFAVKFVLNDGSELSAAMPSYAAALTVNDKSENIVIEDNVYTETVDSTGKYNVDVNSIYTEALLASASFNVKTIQMVVTTEVNGTTVTVTVKVAKDATGKVGFHLDQLLGIKYVDVRDGVAVCKYDKLAAGEHTVDVSYQGDDYAYPVSKVAFTVNDPKISAEDVDKFYRGSEQYVVTVVDGTPLAGETVSIFINGVEYTRVTDENGQAKMDINLNPGIYKVTAVYKGETVTNTIVVKSTVLGNDLTKMYCNDSQYYATFLDSEGKVLANTAVWFNINGVIYNRVTDEHGIAGLNINLLPDEYILTAYNSVTGQLFTNMVYVLPQLVQLKTVDNLVALEVLDKSGKPVKAGEEVLLNFNGKVLSATSDANGMVFFADPSFDGTFATAYYDGCLVNVNLSTPKAKEIIW